MAMGPTNQSEKVELSRFDRLNYSVKKAIAAYVDRPLHYLFCLGSVSVLALLVLNRPVSWQLYVLIGLLTFYELKPVKTKSKTK